MKLGWWLWLGGYVAVGMLHAADVEIQIPPGGVDTNVHFNVATLGEPHTVHIYPARCNHFDSGPTVAPLDSGVEVAGIPGECGGTYTIRLTTSTQAWVHITGHIERGTCDCSPPPGGGNGKPPPGGIFNVNVLNRFAWIVFTQPTNGTNLTCCAGTTNNLEAKVSLGTGTDASGTVTFSATPSNLGSFNPVSVALAGGKADTHFYAATNGGSGLLTASAHDMVDDIGATVPNVSTNITANVVKVVISNAIAPNVCVSYTFKNANNSPPNVLIANTNQIYLTAIGTPDDGTGIYTWIHPRGGSFSTNAVQVANQVTYSAPEFPSATPPTATDKVTVTYTYHGVSCSTNTVLNILRPKTLVVTNYEVVNVPSCTGNNGTYFDTRITWNVKDQFGNVMQNLTTCSLSWFETFNNFVAGSPVVPTNGTFKGIQTGILTALPEFPNTLNIMKPGDNDNVSLPLRDDLFDDINQGWEQTFWNSTGPSNAMAQADNTYTIQGARFFVGTYVSYCATNPPSGAKILRGGSEITVGTTIDASN